MPAYIGGTTSNVNAAWYYLFAVQFGWTVDNIIGGPATAQITATRIRNNGTQVKQSVASGSLILPRVLTGEAIGLMVILNDSGVTLNIYPASGENVNGTVNSPLSLPTGQAGICLPILNPIGSIGALDWRATAHA